MVNETTSIYNYLIITTLLQKLYVLRDSILHNSLYPDPTVTSYESDK